MSRLATLIFATVLLSVLIWAGIRAATAWQFVAAESISEHLVFTQGFPEAELTAASARVESALALWPSHPGFLFLRGYLQELRATQPGIGLREKRNLLQRAAADHRASLATRPLWPYSWSALLQVKEKLGEIDGEFRLALHQASETGPWEPRVQLDMVRTGLRRWDELNTEHRGLVSATIDRSLKVQPRKAFELIKSYSRPDLLCPLKLNEPQIQHWCSLVTQSGSPTGKTLHPVIPESSVARLLESSHEGV